MAFLAPKAFTYDVEAIMRRLGQTDADGPVRSPRWKARYLTKLIDEAGFPRPIPLMVGATLHPEVTTRSRWQIPPVDHWFGDRHPPAAAAEDLAARRAAEQVMDDRAARLGLRLVAANG